LASSMAAAIKNNLGLTAQLVEGHDGIFLVTVNGQNLYDNRGECCRLPGTGDILKTIQGYLGSNPIVSSPENKKVQTPPIKANKAGEGCSCLDITQSVAPIAGSCCCTPPDKSQIPAGQSPCYVSQGTDSSATDTEKRRLDIEFLYLDLNVCVPCQGTQSSLEEAISEVSRVLEATGIEVEIRKIHVQSEEQALELGFVSSPTIRINGRDIQLEVKESLCESCGDLCGDDVDCRVWVYQGKEYTVPPKGMIIEAILREVYREPNERAVTITPPAEIPGNLKRFFAARQRKKTTIINNREV